MIKDIYELFNPPDPSDDTKRSDSAYLLKGSFSDIIDKKNKINKGCISQYSFKGVSFKYLGVKEGNDYPPYLARLNNIWGRNNVNTVWTGIYDKQNFLLSKGSNIVHYPGSKYQFEITKEGECIYILNVFGIEKLVEKLVNSFKTVQIIKKSNRFLWEELSKYFPESILNTASELGEIGF